MPPDKLTIEEEHELFLRFKADPEVISEIYDRHAKPLYSFLLKRSGHKETAEDLVAHTFMKLVESHSKLEWKGVPIGAWLYRVAVNALADHWRSAKVRKESATLDDDDDYFDPPSNDDPAWNTEMTIERERLMKVMKHLSGRDQEVLTLRFYGGYKTEDVATELGISNNHAAVLIYRALGRMRKNLIESKA
ncbi:MAG: sigma-70 family RNA polymerase sigma factor [Patescibacteria group bacterium]|nr:sigma-70 family RNA polymerase sigma factor [Patescibacteria group bacterium]